MDIAQFLKSSGAGLGSFLLAFIGLLLSRKLVPGAWADEQIKLERENAAKWEQRYIELTGLYIRAVHAAQKGADLAEKAADK